MEARVRTGDLAGAEVPAAARAHVPPRSKAPWLALAAVLLTLFVMFHALDMTWPALAAWQQGSVFKQVSGYLLALSLAWQWRLAFLRGAAGSSDLRRHLKQHKWTGALLSLLLFLHCRNLGYGYQSILLGVLLGVVLLGIFNHQDLRIRRPGYAVFWSVAHIGLAAALPVLVLYHLYVVYSY